MPLRGRWLTVAIMVMVSSGAVRVMAEDEEEPLGTVVVTATRTAVPLESVTSAISVVSDRDIENTQSPTVTDALRDVPGVEISQSGSVGKTTSVFIRGADADQSLILFDGVEVNSVTLGGFNFGNIMTDDIGAIEVLRGAGSTLYGSEAIGGVVNIITKKGEGPPRLSMSSAGGNVGTASELATFSGQSGIVSYSASLGYLTTAGFRPDNDDFSNLTSAARLDLTPIEHGTLRAFWRSANSSLGLADNNIGSGYGDFVDPNARQQDEFYLAKGEWEQAPVENLTYRVSGAYSRTLNTLSDEIEPEVLTSPNFFGDAFFLAYSRVPNEIAMADTQVNYSEGSFGISTAGFEFKEKSGKLKSIYLDGGTDRFDHSRSNYAGYVQQQIHLLDDRFTAVGGFRVDGNEDFGNEVSSSWSVGYLEDWGREGRWDTHVKGGYAEGFRAPTFNELFYPKSGNKNLDAETSSEYSGGLRQHLGVTWLAIDGTYFTRRTKNLIQFTPVSQCPDADVSDGVFFTSCNVGRADVSGVETGINIGPVMGVSLRGTYSYLDWELSGGQPLLRRPHNQMAASVNYQRGGLLDPADLFSANLRVFFVGERHDIDTFTFLVVDDQPSYTPVDLALRYETALPWQGAEYRIGGFARVQNLFDRQYDEVRGFRSPPINVLAGLRVTL